MLIMEAREYSKAIMACSQHIDECSWALMGDDSFRVIVIFGGISSDEEIFCMAMDKQRDKII